MYFEISVTIIVSNTQIYSFQYYSWNYVALLLPEFHKIKLEKNNTTL